MFACLVAANSCLWWFLAIQTTEPLHEQIHILCELLSSQLGDSKAVASSNGAAEVEKGEKVVEEQDEHKRE